MEEGGGDDVDDTEDDKEEVEEEEGLEEEARGLRTGSMGLGAAELGWLGALFCEALYFDISVGANAAHCWYDSRVSFIVCDSIFPKNNN